MTGPFRSEQGPLAERVRRAEEENAVAAEENAAIAKEIALRTELRGRGRDGVLWGFLVCAAILAGIVGALAGSLDTRAARQARQEEVDDEKRFADDLATKHGITLACRDGLSVER